MGMEKEVSYLITTMFLLGYVFGVRDKFPDPDILVYG